MSPATAAPSKHAILSLYHSTLRVSNSFSSYNFRNYFLKRARENFRAMQEADDTSALSKQYSEAVKELAVLRRSAIVNQLYGGWRLAVEDENAKKGMKSAEEETQGEETIRERGVN
ncbi:uncharacterized protein SCHCODRAFT_02570664 [Schizophyllum commune H4-8]|uniref:Complex 1 LYR protein domain-containing protein n=1 Tax=Schizophyllum commune (strain H4-8 / FGSC 9210) TaxID=578458 RepID=D8PY18_SCHCM|nr:uncharacterized protein SCHCODRAFT_02570664 [Schizophyllum commune H4-8]KAI5897136.1 hypothetical protein SCHCODRAFT_02570664 [Schizophyllum commune H4-8]